MARYGTVELGGTKTLVGAGSNPDDLENITRIPTTDPEATVSSVLDALSGLSLDALGVAAFGPVELRDDHRDYGSITTTPKPGWSGYRLLDDLADIGVPIGLDTDVGGAALGEGRWGNARGLTNFVYMTVGTGIGAGAVVDGDVLKGVGHPEMGHVVVRRMPGDSYQGHCPFHGDCLEGMASGPALEERFGPTSDWDDEARVLAVTTDYLAQGLRNIIYTLSPQRIIVGGGVSQIEGFHGALRDRLRAELGGYPGLVEYAEPDFVVGPGLGGLSGLAGGLVLAERAAGR